MSRVRFEEEARRTRRAIVFPPSRMILRFKDELPRSDLDLTRAKPRHVH